MNNTNYFCIKTVFNCKCKFKLIYYQQAENNFMFQIACINVDKFFFLQRILLFRFMSDQEGWQELCELYLLEQDLARAAFCMEELLIHNPHSHLIHQRYAEIRYSQVSFYSTKIFMIENNLCAYIFLIKRTIDFN